VSRRAEVLLGTMRREQFDIWKFMHNPHAARAGRPDGRRHLITPKAAPPDRRPLGAVVTTENRLHPARIARAFSRLHYGEATASRSTPGVAHERFPVDRFSHAEGFHPLILNFWSGMVGCR
jgi:hypothetical protein